MASAFERMKTAWESPDRRAELNRVVELMATEGVTREMLDEALGRLLDEVRDSGADDATEEIVMSVGDRLHGWCHASRRVSSRRVELPTEGDIARLPRWAQVAFAARCARRTWPILKHNWPQSTDWRLVATTMAIQVAEISASRGAPDSGTRDAIRNADRAASAAHSEDPNYQRPWSLSSRAAATRYAAQSVISSNPSENAVGAALMASLDDPRIVLEIITDLHLLLRLSKIENWNDDTPVPTSVFGPMWPNGAPPGWPTDPPSKVVAVTGHSVSMSVAHGVAVGVTANQELPDPLIDVHFAEGEFSSDDMQLFLDFLAASYRELDGTGLKVVEGHTMVPDEAEVLQ